MERNMKVLKRVKLNEREYLNLCVWDDKTPINPDGVEFIVWISLKERPNDMYQGCYYNNLDSALECFNEKISNNKSICV